jgi:hypothetical protein
MEKQVLVIQYVGEKPTAEEAAAAIVAMQRAGTYIDTTVQPTMCHLTEKEQAMAVLMFRERKRKSGEGITVKVEQDPVFKGIDKDKAKKFAQFLKDIIDG